MGRFAGWLLNWPLSLSFLVIKSCCLHCSHLLVGFAAGQTAGYFSLGSFFLGLHLVQARFLVVEELKLWMDSDLVLVLVLVLVLLISLKHYLCPN